MYQLVGISVKRINGESGRGNFIFLKINKTLYELCNISTHAAFPSDFFFPMKKLKKQIVSFVRAPSNVLPLLLQAKARTRTTQVKRGSSHRGTVSVLPSSPTLRTPVPHAPPLSRPPQRAHVSAALHGCECSDGQAYCKHCARWPLTFDPQGASDARERGDSGTRCRLPSCVVYRHNTDQENRSLIEALLSILILDLFVHIYFGHTLSSNVRLIFPSFYCRYILKTSNI